MGQRREKESRGADEELHSSRLRDVYKNGIHQKKKLFLSRRYPIKTPNQPQQQQHCSIFQTENAISV